MRDTLTVPTSVITGFLGAGKSTAILHLLEHKAADEKWAVLVNEFGEVGIDGGLLRGQGGEERGVFVQEVPGGCMCCAAGLPMQIALAMLLAERPLDRLLIEPTGLGHPREVLDLLSAEQYEGVLDLRATLTLVDARAVRAGRYTEHPTFLQQLAVADVLVANKADLCEEDDLVALRGFLASTDAVHADTPLFEVAQGALRSEWLDQRSERGFEPSEHGHAHAHEHGHEHGQAQPEAAAQLPVAPRIPEEGYLRFDNRGEGFVSQGWIYDPAWVFDAARVEALLLGVQAARVKAVLRTTEGVVAYNMADGVMTKSTLLESPDSRVEALWPEAAAEPAGPEHAAGIDLESALLDCVQRADP